jgi:hypothetical protein
MITSGSRNERKNEQQGACHKITRGDSKNSEPERPFALPKHLVGADRAYLNALFDFSLAGSRFSSDFRRCRCRRPNSDVLARKRDGWGLLQVPQAPPSPLAPSPGGAFLCGTNPRARNLSRCGMPQRTHSAMYPSYAWPRFGGAFSLEPVAARRELSCFRDQSPVTPPRPLRWGLSLSRDRRDRGQNLVVGWRPARLSGADHEGNDAQG